jgi:hypothetical protein
VKRSKAHVSVSTLAKDEEVRAASPPASATNCAISSVLSPSATEDIEQRDRQTDRTMQIPLEERTQERKRGRWCCDEGAIVDGEGKT